MHPEPTALLQRWYSLVREKRVSRQDFLKALLKSFDITPSLKSSQVSVVLCLLITLILTEIRMMLTS